MALGGSLDGFLRGISARRRAAEAPRNAPACNNSEILIIYESIGYAILVADKSSADRDPTGGWSRRRVPG